MATAGEEHSLLLGASVFHRLTNRIILYTDFSSKLLEMQEWLQPVKSIPSLTYDGIAAAVTQLKQYTEDMQKVPRGLITTMRILRSLSVAPHRKYPDGVLVCLALQKSSPHENKTHLLL